MIHFDHAIFPGIRENVSVESALVIESEEIFEVSGPFDRDDDDHEETSVVVNERNCMLLLLHQRVHPEASL